MGFLFGIVSAATFGLIPFFSLPLMRRGGLGLENVLFYRFFLGFCVLGVILLARGERFYLPRKDIGKIALLSFMYSMSALLYFWGFSEAPSGIATTVHFTYPIMVMLLMIGFFHERFSWLTLAAITLAVSGVALLVGVGQGSLRVEIVPLLVLLASALANGIYITGIHVARLRHISGLMVTFYLLGFGALYAFINAQAQGCFELPADRWQLASLFALALITAVISNVTLVLAIKRIGSTPAALLGAVEPLTAVVVGVLVFGEPFTSTLVLGVAFIISAVAVVMLGPRLVAAVRQL